MKVFIKTATETHIKIYAKGKEIEKSGKAHMKRID